MARHRATICYVNGVPNRPNTGSCQGSGEEDRPCNTQPCGPQGVWKDWAQISSCSVTCGTGTATFQGRCYVNGQPSNPSQCSGPGTKTQNCNLSPCATGTWRNWKLVGQCSRTCGGGTGIHEGQCYSNGGLAPPSQCSGSRYQERPCNENPCARYIYGQWKASACSVTCGSGSITEYRDCEEIGTRRVVQVAFCQSQGPSQRTNSCFMGPCRKQFAYGEWEPAGQCGVSCGAYGLVLYKRKCFTDATYQQVTNLYNCQHLGESSKMDQCQRPDCPVQYWVDWTDALGCTRMPDGQCRKTQTRKCYVKTPTGYKEPGQGLCNGAVERTVKCENYECPFQG